MCDGQISGTELKVQKQTHIHENVAYGEGDESVGENGLFNTSCWNKQVAIRK